MIMIPDYSALISGLVHKLVEKGGEVIIGNKTLALVERAMRDKKTDGTVGMAELNAVRKLVDGKKVSLRFIGEQPRYLDRLTIEDADWESREIALAEGGTLVSCSSANAKTAEAIGIQVSLIKKESHSKLDIAKFFDKTTMSVHIKDGLPVYAKKGQPGGWTFEKLSDKVLTPEDVEAFSQDIIEKTKANPDAFLEIEKRGATVVQYEDYRIVLAWPPFSKGIEITAVRPVAKLTLDDYKLQKELMDRFEARAEGIIIAGAPGAGKSTLAQALAEFYAAKKKIVKTIEHPRDLNVTREITQYGHLEGDPAGTGEVLLLVRPDFTVYDELRKTRDFEVYSDMRLAGVGMIGVVHAAKAIDAIHRFLGRLEMGVIPQVLDTVLFIKGGQVHKVYELEMKVKVPSGMTEADLARPVVEIKDFFTKKPEFEIYTYGEQTIIVPVVEDKDPIREMAGHELRRRLKKLVPHERLEVKINPGGGGAVVYTDKEAIPKMIGKGGKHVEELEKHLGVSLDIRDIETLPREDRHAAKGSGPKKVEFQLDETAHAYTFYFDRKVVGRQLNFTVNGEFLFSAVVGKKGKIKVGKNTDLGTVIMDARSKKQSIEVKV
ncbi:MAG: Flp pilus assembly complex ATPase component TadA [Candidatus Altiarchaeota archaeon]|nr:Flp pilus assembly complex ATPase component TadA [Candidatus Altiarchaeota archaeon]